MRRDVDRPRPGVVQRSLLDAIGDTPVVELRSLCDDARGRLFAKLESHNPSGTRHDRVARQVLTDARTEGRLARCQTVVAAVDGAQGVAFAQACAVLRHPLIAVLARAEADLHGASMVALGAELVVVDDLPGVPSTRVISARRARSSGEVERLVALTGGYDPDLLSNPSAFRAHRLGTGDELVRQIGGEFGVFVDFAATGATLAGCAAALHEFDPTVRCYAVEPVGAAALSGEDVLDEDHGIVGGGYGLAQLPLLTRERLAGVVQVSRQEALDAARALAVQEGILAGLSTGANVAAALKLMDGECFGETIVVLVHDRDSRQLEALASGPAEDRRDVA